MLIELFLLQIRIPDYALEQMFAMTNHWMQLYNLVLHYVFKIMITKLFYFDLIEKKFAKNFSDQKFKAKNYVIKWWKRKRFKNCRFHIHG